MGGYFTKRCTSSQKPQDRDASIAHLQMRRQSLKETVPLGKAGHGSWLLWLWSFPVTTELHSFQTGEIRKLHSTLTGKVPVWYKQLFVWVLCFATWWRSCLWRRCWVKMMIIRAKRTSSSALSASPREAQPLGKGALCAEATSACECYTEDVQLIWASLLGVPKSGCTPGGKRFSKGTESAEEAGLGWEVGSLDQGLCSLCQGCS